MNDFTITISLADLVLIATLVRAIIVAARWIIRKIVIYIWDILNDIRNHHKRE